MMILIIFLAIVSFLTIIVFSISLFQRNRNESDAHFLNEDGDHVYYDRSIIEKKNFKRHYPYIKNVRTFRRLFGNKPEDKL